MSYRYVCLAGVLVVALPALATGPVGRPHPVSMIQLQESPTGRLWTAAANEVIIVSDAPGRFAYSRGSVGTAVELDTPFGDQVLRLEGWTEMRGVFLIWAQTASQTVLFRTDGSQVGTYPVWVGGLQGEKLRGSVTACGSVAYFNVDGAMWRTDGTVAGTRRLRDTPAAAVQNVGGQALFFAGPAPMRIWTTDGTTTGTTPVSGTTLQLPEIQMEYFLSSVGGGALFYGDGPTQIRQRLYMLTSTGPQLAGGPTGRPEWMISCPGQRAIYSIWFMVDSVGNNWYEVWWIDGVPAHARLVGTFTPNDYCGLCGQASGDRLFVTFARSHSWSPAADRIRVFSLNGTPQWVGPSVSGLVNNASCPAVNGGRAYFLASDGVHGRELWSTDGTATGTSMLLDLLPGRGNASTPLQSPRVVGNRLYWEASDGPSPYRIWMLDLRPADFDNSGAVGVQDVLSFVQSYVRGEDRADANGDGAVSIEDVYQWLQSYFGDTGT